MKILKAVVLCFLLVATGRAEDDSVLPIEDTSSPQGICIAHFLPQDEYKFWNTKTKKIVGEVFPPDRQGLSNLHFVADWNAKGTRLALLFYYGTKLSDFYLYDRSSDGTITNVSFDYPDSSDVYARVHKQIWELSDSGGESCNSLGPWIDDNTVRLISGDQKEFYDKQSRYLGTSTLLVTFKVHFNDSAVVISDEKLVGPLSDAERDAFLTKWGDQYQ